MESGLVSNSKMVARGVRTAFLALGDLKRERTFVRSEDATFDFATQSMVGTNTDADKAEAIIVNAKRASQNRRVISRQLLVEVAKLQAIQLYTSVIDGELVWQIADIEYADNFIAILNIYREGRIDG